MMSISPHFESTLDFKRSLHNLPNDQQLHKRRKGNDSRPSKVHSETIPPPNYQIPFNPYLSFGTLQSPNSFSSPVVNIPNNQVLNDNMFASYPPPSNIQTIQVPIDMKPLDPNFHHSNMNQIQNRQAMLEQLKVQEQHHQQLLKPKLKDGISPLASPTSEKRSSHNDLVIQHMEEYKMKQMQKDAVRQANTRFGLYVAQESSHFNFIIPSLPTNQ